MTETNQTLYKIIEILETNDEMTSHEVAKLADVSPRQANRILTKLRKEGRVSRREVYHRPTTNKWLYSLSGGTQS